jgi:hypothetical protein
MGRPRLNVNPDDVRKLAAINCTDKEIAAFCQCSEAYLRTNMRDALDQGRAMCKVSIKRKLWEAMNKGNIAATIFLGKAVCGMREVSEMIVGGKSAVEEMTDDELRERTERIRALRDARKRAGEAGAPAYDRMRGEDGEARPVELHPVRLVETDAADNRPSHDGDMRPADEGG